MKKWKRWTFFKATLGLLAVWAMLFGTPMAIQADDFDEYAQEGKTIDLPPAGGFDGEYFSWFTAAEYFPEGTAAVIDHFEAVGRVLAATGRELYLQRNYGSGGTAWDVVATVSGGTMDPCFVRISPDGTRIALGIGYGAPLLVFPTSMLSISAPPDLHNGNTAADGVTAFNVNYYDAAWVDNRYIVINGGEWPGPDYGSSVGVIDADNPVDTGTALIGNIPGASASIAVDRTSGALVTGIGYAPYYDSDPDDPENETVNRTGEIKVWASGEWSTSPTAALDYEGNNRILAANALSAAYLGFDKEGALHVGGGDAFGIGGATENGYAALIRSTVVDRVANGTPGAPVNEGSINEYLEFAPDPCANDSATGIIYGDWGEALTVVWNPLTMPGSCNGAPGSATEYWNPGVVPRMTTYYPDGAPDSDGDGIADASDNAFMTANAGQEDTDEDGYGNAADGDFNNDGVVNYSDFTLFRNNMLSPEPEYDMNSDGTVNYSDFTEVRSRMLTSAPWY